MPSVSQLIMIHRSRVVSIIAAFVFGLVSACPALGQLPQIRLNAVFPAGGCAGSTVHLTVTGSTDADEATQLIFSNPGIRAVPGRDAAGSVVVGTFDVTIDESVLPGYCDVRLGGLFGISNPRAFRIDTLPEIAESEPNNTKDSPQQLNLNQVVNARSNKPTDVDVFHVVVKAGQTVVIRTEAARIDSLMQPVIEVFDGTGRRILKSRRVLSREAATVFVSDTDQELTITVRDLVYAGGETYPYRLSVDTRPLIDFVWPPVVPAGAESSVTVYGRHLPGGAQTDLHIDGMPVFRQLVAVPALLDQGPSLGARAAAGVISTRWWNSLAGNTLQIAVCRAGVPVYRETDPIVRDGNRLTSAFTVTGHFPPVGQDSLLRFFCGKDEIREIDVYAERLGIPANPLLIVERVARDENGEEVLHRLAVEDDGRQNPGGKQLPTLTLDPSFRLTAPATGLYQLRISDRDADTAADPRNLFVVDVHQPKPDFELVAFESIASTDGQAPVTNGAVSLRKGGHYEVPVFVFRRGGHNEPIRLEVADLPDGVSCQAGLILSGSDSTVLLLCAKDDAVETVTPVRIMGRSGTIRRVARVATLLHAGVNGLPRTARVADSLLVSVMKDVEPFTITLGLASAEMHQDQQLLIPIHLERRNGFGGKVDIAFLGQPANVDAPGVSFEPDVTSVTARCFFKGNAAVGPAQLFAYGTSAVPWRRNPWNAERSHERVAKIQTQLEEQQKVVDETEANVESINAEVQAVTGSIAGCQEDLQAGRANAESHKQELAAAIKGQELAIADLATAQELQLKAVSAADDSESRLTALTTASREIESAAAQLTAFSAKITGRIDQLQAVLRRINDLESQRLSEETALPELRHKLEEAQAVAAATKQRQDELAKEKAQADEEAKAADEATKPNNVNVRSVSTPIQLSVYKTPGKLTAAIPNGSSISRGVSISATVTIVRKNSFSGPVGVTLISPKSSGLTAIAAEIPADAVQASVDISAAADAPLGGVSNAVFRATAEFNGRTASFDAPAVLEVIE